METSSVGVSAGDDELGADKGRVRAGQWWMVGVLTLLAILSGIDRQIFALLMEPIRLSLGFSSFQIGLLHGLAFAIFFAVFGLIFGWAIDRFDRRWVVFTGVLIWSTAATASGIASNVIQLALARFGVGAGEAALNPAAYSMIGDSFPRNRLSSTIGVFGIGFITSAALSMVVGGFLAAAIPAEGIVLPIIGPIPQWRAIFIITGVPGFLLAFLIWTVREPPRRHRLENASTSVRDAVSFMRSRVTFFAPFIAGVGFLSAGGLALIAWTSSHLIRKFGLTLTEVGLLLGPIQIVTGILGLICSGIISDFLYTRGQRDAGPRVLATLAVLQLLPAVIIAVAESVWLNALAVGLYMFCATGTSALGPSSIQLVTPSNYRGQISAVYMLCTHLLGLTLGPPLVGALVTYVYGEGPTVGWGIASSILILNPIALILFRMAMKSMREIKY